MFQTDNSWLFGFYIEKERKINLLICNHKGKWNLMQRYM
jgi:hypothetical protein